jgi:hypothetical protein
MVEVDRLTENACVRVESDRGEKSIKFFRRELRGACVRTQDRSGEAPGFKKALEAGFD